MKCKQLHPGFELGSPWPLLMITTTLRAPLLGRNYFTRIWLVTLPFSKSRLIPCSLKAFNTFSRLCIFCRRLIAGALSILVSPHLLVRISTTRLKKKEKKNFFITQIFKKGGTCSVMAIIIGSKLWYQSSNPEQSCAFHKVLECLMLTLRYFWHAE